MRRGASIIALLFTLSTMSVVAVAADDSPQSTELDSYTQLIERIKNLPYDQQQVEISRWQREDDAHNIAAAAQQKKDEATTGVQWANSLEVLTGGWQLIDVSTDGQTAYFGTRRSLTRDGKFIYVWFRLEYRHPQTWVGVAASEPYLSLVERDRFDCIRQIQQTVQQNGFAKNNLEEPNVDESITVPDNNNNWTAAIPGTVGEELMSWGCKSAPKAAEAGKQN